MMKISKNGAIGIILISLLMISGLPAILSETQEDSDTLADDVLYSRYLTFHQRKELAVVSMDAIIDLYNENGINTSDLTNLKVKLTDIDADAKKAAETMNRDEFYILIEESREVIKSFRDIVKENDIEGKGEAVKSAVQENKEYLNGLKAETAEVKKHIYLRAIDNRLEKLERISNRLEEKGADVTEINEKIDEISNNRFNISKDSDPNVLKEFHQNAKEDAEELRELIKEAIQELKETK
jgi:tRNA/tmRNA/rRNA uracil-C5-methylase (TrmA/RlmC/RlmD family)